MLNAENNFIIQNAVDKQSFPRVRAKYI